jgi:MoaA/NifB/PqqE/SkfB family radical SAM enzyme
MRVKDVELELAERKSQGAESVGFIGGEPTLYPKLPRVVERARGLGYQRIALCTNGRRLKDLVLLQRLTDAGVTRVTLSIHSHHASTEDTITQRKGSFEEKLAAIRNLVTFHAEGRLPDGFSLNTVLHRKNLSHLAELTTFFKRMGVADIRFNFIRPEHQAVGSRTWVPSFKETTTRVVRLVLKNEAEFKLHLTFADFPLCRLPWEILVNESLRNRYIGESLDLATEVTLYRPEEAGGTQRFNWQEQRQSYLKCQPKPCGKCVLRNHCEGVWRGYLDIYGPEELEGGPALAEASLSTR